jgi:hypothetical protein
MLTFPLAPSEKASDTNSLVNSPLNPGDISMGLADAGGSGNTVPILQYMNRSFTDQTTVISNSYVSSDTHQTTVDLSSFQIPGWTLYQVQIDVANITAIAEREVLGVSQDHDLFRIEEYSDINNWRYNSLAQGFYDMPHDGQLLNYSFYYDSPIYSPVSHGWAYYSILSDNQDSSSNLVAYTQLPTRVLTGAGWENATVASIDLNANTEYYTVINGSALVETTFYPEIYWWAETAAGTFTTEQYDSRFSLWGSFPSEALLNYTYIPWNTTSVSPLVYFDPTTIDTMLDSSPVVGSSWVLNSASNITSFQLSTNQSVNVYYDMTLCYFENNVGSTNWGVDVSGDLVDWNVTTDLTFPAVSNVVARGMDITPIPLDWNATGLLLGGTPAGSFSESGTTVTCTGLSDGTWTLTSIAPNYAVGMSLYDTSDDSAISYKVANTVTMDVNATIEDSIGTQQTGGNTTLSVLQSSSLIYSLTDNPASSGAADFQWDISSTTSGNGTHSVEVQWLSASGLEAGYITQEVFVYYSTTLGADDMSIDDFTEDSFDIGINFDKVSPAMGLDAPTANVTYSFGGAGNTTMTSEGGGRWTATILTTGMENGNYPLTVYAEGLALENQSLVIWVDLDHHSLTLNWSWSNTNDIAYLDSTNLTISYSMTNGTRIGNAMVNITFESQTYNMTFDPVSENYWIELHGVNFTGVPDNFTLAVNAWKAGFESQYLDTIWIYIQSASGVYDFVVEYTPDLDIIFIETMTISVTYNFSSAPIPNATVYVTFDGSGQRNLTFNAFTQQWEIILLGVDYLGTQTINVTAMSDGYITRFEIQTFIVHEDTPILTTSWTGNSSTTDYATLAPLTITLTMSNGTPITDATVSFTAFSTLYPLSTGAGGLYVFNIAPNSTPGIESFTVFVVRTGYVSSQIDLNLTVNATTTIDVVHITSEYEEWNLTVTVTYEDSVSSNPITNATVTMTFDGTVYVLNYSVGVYFIEIVLDVSPGDYTIDVSASAVFAVTATSQTPFRVDPKEEVYLEITFDGDLIAGQFMEIQATLRDNDSNPVQGETIRFEVSVLFDNGTIVVYNAGTMTDQTNAEGVASVGFEVPFGNVDKLTAHALFDGTQFLILLE